MDSFDNNQTQTIISILSEWSLFSLLGRVICRRFASSWKIKTTIYVYVMEMERLLARYWKNLLGGRIDLVKNVTRVKRVTSPQCPELTCVIWCNSSMFGVMHQMCPATKDVNIRRLLTKLVGSNTTVIEKSYQK